MKEELIKVLNGKLDDINSDIDSLIELNENISKEENSLAYISSILDLFKSNSEDNIMNFPSLSKDDFNKVLDIIGNEVKDIFSSPSCNYEGLVYLISGINDGVSLSLTDEQKNSISYLIEKLGEKKNEHESAIEGFDLVKNRYSINSVDELKQKKEKYLNALDEIKNNNYIDNISLIQEAVEFAQLPSNKIIDILKYILEYNATVYQDGTDVRTFDIKKDNNDEVIEQSENLTVIDDTIPLEHNDFEVPEDDFKEEEYQEFHFNDVVKDEFTNIAPLSTYNYEDEEKKREEDVVDLNNEYTPIVEVNNEIEDVNDNNEISDVEEIKIEDTTPSIITYENDELEDDSARVSTEDLQSLLGKYNIKEDNTYINELVVGDIKNYENVLNVLEEKKVVDSFKNNSELLAETLLYSNSDAVKKVLEIIQNDLSVDEDDCVITTKIVINTIPSVFVISDGNYDNFIENIKTFKELDLNLINLFDFSKEIFVANHDTIINNLEIVKKYNINITYQNAKYLLLLKNIGDRLDYYVESVYDVKDKNNKFDGIEYINLYTAKLNTVNDETIKRLRYCSENGNKVFGSKPGSLSGEITNLKVHALSISDDYLNKFFNNEFADLTIEETREYIKLVHNSSNVGNYDDELDILEKYRDGIRYNIEGIHVSYNKVLRNYSILRSYGIDTKKALHFAVCYNLVITKEEYNKLKGVLDELGGDR